MNREEKTVIINSLADKLQQYAHFYLTDTSELNAEQTAKLRRVCFEKDVKLVVVKNTLFITSVMFSDTGKAPAKLIKEFRKESPKPVLKAAVVEGCVYLGDESIDALVNIKSREELIGDIIGLLQSPAKNVISALQASAGQKIAGLVKSLEERN